ncbi:phage head closure protein [Limnobaculum zhutongyuii]|nr:phage head closure protein [Limnobaculum zhutongyuii]
MKRRLMEITGNFRNPKIGELDKWITFRNREDLPADDFGTTAVYQDICSTWGRLAPVGESVRIGSTQIDNAITHKILIRFRTDIDTDSEAVIGGVSYRVKGVTDLNGKKRFLVVNVEELYGDRGF